MCLISNLPLRKLLIFTEREVTIISIVEYHIFNEFVHFEVKNLIGIILGNIYDLCYMY